MIANLNILVQLSLLSMNLYWLVTDGRTIFAATSTVLVLTLVMGIRTKLVGAVRDKRIFMLQYAAMRASATEEEFAERCEAIYKRGVQPSYESMLLDLGKWRYKDWWPR